MQRLPDLTGKTVLVVGGAPCVLGAHNADYIIAASSGIKSAPNADMLVTIDNMMPPYGVGADADFTGLRVVGVPSGNPAHLYIPFPYERVRLAPLHTVEVRNNGLAAIRLAAKQGARRILLAGFDPAKYDAANVEYGYDRVTATAFPALIAELRTTGVEVEQIDLPALPPQPKRKTKA